MFSNLSKFSSFTPDGRTSTDRRCWFSSAEAMLLALGLLVVAGCGQRSDRLAIGGKVTLNGEPLDNGSIRFASTGGEKIFASGAMITNGEYDIPQEKGLPPGTYQIEINAPDTAAPLVSYPAAAGEPSAPPTAPERIPSEYNVNSTHTVEVTKDGENRFVFDIVTGSRK